MNRNKKANVLILISLGLFLVAISQIIWHFFELPDTFDGILVGIGFGLLITAIKKGKFNSAS